MELINKINQNIQTQNRLYWSIRWTLLLSKCKPAKVDFLKKSFKKSRNLRIWWYLKVEEVQPSRIATWATLWLKASMYLTKLSQKLRKRKDKGLQLTAETLSKVPKWEESARIKSKTFVKCSNIDFYFKVFQWTKSEASSTINPS